VTNRRSLTPSRCVSGASGVHAMRRGKVRHEVTERVRLITEAGEVLDGWALNMSRSGIRAVVLEAKVRLGEELDLLVGENEPKHNSRGRVVWIQEEPDGVIVGVAFIRPSGTHRASAPPGEDESTT
jgi:hypothetical protein